MADEQQPIQERLSVRFEGRVQGVGFRATVADIAVGFQVTGRVCNVLDGSVDLQAEGTEEDLLRLMAAIEQRLDRYIIDAHLRWHPISQAQWTDFSIGTDLPR